MNSITGRQSEFLRLVAAHHRTHGVPPTMRWIAKGMGILSPNGVQAHVNALRRKGFLVVEVTRRDARQLVLTSEGWATMGMLGPADMEAAAKAMLDLDVSPETRAMVRRHFESLEALRALPIPDDETVGLARAS